MRWRVEVSRVQSGRDGSGSASVTTGSSLGNFPNAPWRFRLFSSNQKTPTAESWRAISVFASACGPYILACAAIAAHIHLLFDKMLHRVRKGTLSEGQQGFEGRESAVPAGGSQSVQRICKVLQVGERDGGERLPCPGAKTVDVGAIGPLGVKGAAVEPDLDQVGVGTGLWEGGRIREGAQRAGKGDFGVHWWQDSRKAG